MNDMLRYIIKRLIMGVFVVFVVSIMLFGIMQLMPGDPIQLITSIRVPKERIDQLRHLWGLDKPVYVQYFYWLSRVVQGDFGTSISTGQHVINLIGARLPYTLMLTGLALVVEYIIAIPLGLIAAAKKNSRFDGILVVASTIFFSMPDFWLGIILIIIFGIGLKILPISGFSGITSLILPVLAMAIPSMSQQFRIARAEVLEVLREKYVLTAYAKGLNKNKVLYRHVLRNALITVTVMFFLNLPWLIGGTVVIESTFALPGMGQLLWKAIGSQDYPIVQGIILIITILTVVCNILGDFVSALLDPRIRLGQKGESV